MATQDCIRTKKLEIVDDKGKVRCEIGCLERGGKKSSKDVVLILRRSNGTIGAFLAVNNDGQVALSFDGIRYQWRLNANLDEGSIELRESSAKPGKFSGEGVVLLGSGSGAG